MASTTVATGTAVARDRSARAAVSARAAFETRQVLARLHGSRPAARTTFATVSTVAVLTGVATCTASTAKSRAFNYVATPPAVAAVTTNQATPPAGTADAA
jgi:hypothetical protein